MKCSDGADEQQEERRRMREDEDEDGGKREREMPLSIDRFSLAREISSVVAIMRVSDRCCCYSAAECSAQHPARERERRWSQRLKTAATGEQC